MAYDSGPVLPVNHSVNEGISRELSSISYASVDDAVEQILQLGRGTQLVKLDLEKAYRNTPVHPQDHHLLAISWEGSTYVDRALPFGLRSAPKIFSAVADMIAWALHCAGIQHQIHYLDDFLFLGAPGTGEAAGALAIALRVLDQMGFPVAVHKTEGPSSCITFLGILIDTASFELRLPVGKSNDCKPCCSLGAPGSHVQGENWNHCLDTFLMQPQWFARVALSYVNYSACYT